MLSLPKIAIVDTETTGLNRQIHQIFEIAVTVGDPNADGSGYEWTERVFHLDVKRGAADPGAFRVNNFYDRLNAAESEDTDFFWKIPCKGFYGGRTWSDPGYVAREVAGLLAGRTVIGAVPDFDAYRLEDWLKAHGECGAWDYHLVDVETLVSGYVRGILAAYAAGLPEATVRQLIPAAEYLCLDDIVAVASPKWKSTELLALVGIEPPKGRHTALADCRWAREAYCKVYGLKI